MSNYYQKYLKLLLGTNRDMSFARGAYGEALVKELLYQLDGWTVKAATMDEQINKNFDLSITSQDGSVYQIEVKTEFKAQKTGNIFLETNVGNKPGYLYKYAEDSPVIFAYVFPHQKVIRMTTLQKLRSIDLSNYTLVASNDGSNNYSAEGYLVPTRDLQRICNRTYYYEYGQNPDTFTFTLEEQP